MSTKVVNTISAFVHDENLETLKKLKMFLEEKMDDADEVNDMIDEFTSTLSVTIMKSSKKIKSSTDKPKKTRKPTFYNYWLGERLRTFSVEQKDLPEGERVGKEGRMKVISDEWKEFKKDIVAYDKAKIKWEELSSSDEIFNKSNHVKEEVKKVKEEVKKVKEEVEKVKEVKEEVNKKVKKSNTKKLKIVPKVEDSDSEDEDNSPVSINSDSENDD